MGPAMALAYCRWTRTAVSRPRPVHSLDSDWLAHFRWHFTSVLILSDLLCCSLALVCISRETLSSKPFVVPFTYQTHDAKKEENCKKKT